MRSPQPVEVDRRESAGIGRRRSEHCERTRAVRRRGDDAVRHFDSQIAAAGSGLAVLAQCHVAQRYPPRRSVRAAGQHPPDRSEPGSGGRDSVSAPTPTRGRVGATGSSADFLSTPLQFLKGVGPRKAADLTRAGLVLVEDLLYRLPFRYEDRSRMQPIATLRAGNKAAVMGEIKSAHLAVTRRRGFKIFHAVIADQSGPIRCTWMNQAFLADILKPHLQVIVFGDVKLDSTGLHFMNPEYELVSDDLSAVHTGRVVPFYEKAGMVTPNMQRRLVRQVLDQLPPEIPDVLPPDVRERLQLVSRRQALEESHF